MDWGERYHCGPIRPSVHVHVHDATWGDQDETVGYTEPDLEVPIWFSIDLSPVQTFIK